MPPKSEVDRSRGISCPLLPSFPLPCRTGRHVFALLPVPTKEYCSEAALALLNDGKAIVMNSTINLVTDSKSAAADISGTKGAPGIFDKVKDMHTAAHAFSRIEVTWESRSTANMMLADLFSRSTAAKYSQGMHPTSRYAEDSTLPLWTYLLALAGTST